MIQAAQGSSYCFQLHGEVTGVIRESLFGLKPMCLPGWNVFTALIWSFFFWGKLRKALWPFQHLAFVRGWSTVGSAFENLHLSSNCAECVSGNVTRFSVFDGVVFQFEIHEDQGSPERILKIVDLDELSIGIKSRQGVTRHFVTMSSNMSLYFKAIR